MHAMNIGDAAAAAGVTPKMIRHYESLRLIPEADRTEAGYRLYGESDVAMLRFIRQARALGFPMAQIESLLALWRDGWRRSREVREVALRQLADLAERQREIDQMRGTLESLVARCPGDDNPHCAILESLAGQTAAAPHVASARRALKQVRPGQKIATSRPKRPAAPAQPAGHAGLMAWTRSIARG